MDWVRGEPVGHGSFGKVSLAVPRKQSTQVVVVKSCAASCSATLMNEKLILDEIKGCPQIINCLGDSYTYENGEKLYNILLEYASGGALSKKLKNSSDQVVGLMNELRPKSEWSDDDGWKGEDLGELGFGAKPHTRATARPVRVSGPLHAHIKSHLAHL
ncbi:hypothetical protein RND71_011549 [Anisodus tanguticus]|uniref:Protein kinase domain-containing protein n=1 Tax=Anisodus tanguticus TaxID=243964 RepID=A0AAE1SDZ3_9SOLA|nr:hypothetical protein RND71_011549 [Anisodus tanguticus]